MGGGTAKRGGAQLLLRFPESSDLRERLNMLAVGNNRSLTAEIVHRLEASLTAEGVEGPNWLQKIQQSPRIQTEKRILALEVQLDLLKDRLAAIEGKG